MPLSPFHHLPCPLLILAADGSLRFANHEGEQWLGSGGAALLGKKLSDFIDADSPLHALLEKVRQSGALAKEYDLPVSGPRMRPTTVNLQISPYGEGELLLLIDEKISGGKLEQQLTRREAIKSAGMMAAMLAHEVKNPLSGIKGAAQLLEQSVTGEDTKLAQLIQREVDRINALLQQIDVFSDQPVAREEEVNLHEALQYVVTLMRQSAGHLSIQERYDPSLPPVRGNRAALIQLFLNLIKNAAEALEGQANATITLVTSYRGGYRVKLPGSEHFSAVPITVMIEDNGPGVPDEVRKHVFGPFVTSKPGGKGLGLAIVAKIAADHGGAVELECEDALTRFKVMLPYSGIRD